MAPHARGTTPGNVLYRLGVVGKDADDGGEPARSNFPRKQIGDERVASVSPARRISSGRSADSGVRSSSMLLMSLFKYIGAG
jgi:hypothetical protein